MVGQSQMPVSPQESWLWRPATCWDNYPNQVSGCLEAGGRIEVIRVPVATGRRAKPGHDTIIPPQVPSLFLTQNREGWAGVRIRTRPATKPPPLVTSRDGELTPCLLIGVLVLGE